MISEVSSFTPSYPYSVDCIFNKYFGSSVPLPPCFIAQNPILQSYNAAKTASAPDTVTPGWGSTCSHGFQRHIKKILAKDFQSSTSRLTPRYTIFKSSNTRAYRAVRMPKSRAERSTLRPSWADQRALGSERARICLYAVDGSVTVKLMPLFRIHGFKSAKDVGIMMSE